MGLASYFFLSHLGSGDNGPQAGIIRYCNLISLVEGDIEVNCRPAESGWWGYGWYDDSGIQQRSTEKLLTAHEHILAIKINLGGQTLD